jgi:hypothetical protein
MDRKGNELVRVNLGTTSDTFMAALSFTLNDGDICRTNRMQLRKRLMDYMHSIVDVPRHPANMYWCRRIALKSAEVFYDEDREAYYAEHAAFVKRNLHEGYIEDRFVFAHLVASVCYIQVNIDNHETQDAPYCMYLSYDRKRKLFQLWEPRVLSHLRSKRACKTTR